MIDPTTAQGWTMTDSGHWLYYKEGRILTGWHTIGGSDYYFGNDGSMAANTNVDGYEVGSDGARTQ